MGKVPVSVIIGILNEAENLPACLGAIAWADEVFVVDSGSIDGSRAIAESSGAKVSQFKFNGIWPKKKNWALSPAAGGRGGNRRDLRGKLPRFRRLLHKQALHVHGKMAQARLLPELEPEAL